MDALVGGETPGRPLVGQNTSIGVVATNVALTKTEARKVAQMAHDGLARAIRPVHTPWDGDALFALSAGAVKLEQPTLVVGVLAAEAVARAVVRAVTMATDFPVTRRPPTSPAAEPSFRGTPGGQVPRNPPVDALWKKLGPRVEIPGSRVENLADSVEEWRSGGGIPVGEAVEKRCGAVGVLWKACGSPVDREGAVPGGVTE